MRVLVIGGSGYLGSLVNPFLAQHHTLRVFDVNPPSDLAMEHIREIKYIRGSVCDPEALANAVKDTDVVLYMAMGSHIPLDGDDWARIESRVNAFDVKVKGMHLALHAAHVAGISHAVLTSSMSVYADNGSERSGSDEETPPDSDYIYGFTNVWERKCAEMPVVCGV